MNDESKRDALPDWANEIMPELGDDEAVREFGRQFAMDGILRDHFATRDGQGANAELNANRSGAGVVEPHVGTRNQRTTRLRWILGALALAASVLALAWLPGWFTLDQNGMSFHSWSTSGQSAKI